VEEFLFRPCIYRRISGGRRQCWWLHLGSCKFLFRPIGYVSYDLEWSHPTVIVLSYCVEHGLGKESFVCRTVACSTEPSQLSIRPRPGRKVSADSVCPTCRSDERPFSLGGGVRQLDWPIGSFHSDLQFGSRV
jgi:hypothetical protein